MSKENIKSPLAPQPNYVLTTISVAMVLFLLAAIGLFYWHSNRSVSYFKEQMTMVVELNNDAKAWSQEEWMSHVQAIPGVKEGSFQYVSKEEGLKEMAKDFGEDFLVKDFPNPLQDLVTLRLNADYVDEGHVNSIKSDLSKMPGVTSVNYDQKTSTGISLNLKRVIYILAILTALLAIISMALIYNTVKLALYSNRQLIRNMELIGAKWSFIRLPFIKRASKQGLVAGLIAVMLCVAMMGLIYMQFPSIEVIWDQWATVAIFILTLVLGVLIMAIASFTIVNKFLRLSPDKLKLA